MATTKHGEMTVLHRTGRENDRLGPEGAQEDGNGGGDDGVGGVDDVSLAGLSLASGDSMQYSVDSG